MTAVDVGAGAALGVSLPTPIRLVLASCTGWGTWRPRSAWSAAGSLPPASPEGRHPGYVNSKTGPLTCTYGGMRAFSHFRRSTPPRISVSLPDALRATLEVVPHTPRTPP